MKKFLAIFLCFFLFFRSSVYAASASVPVPAPAPVPSPGGVVKYVVGLLIASWLADNSDVVVETTEEFYDFVYSSYQSLAPKAKEAISSAFSSAVNGVVSLSSDALHALDKLCDIVAHYFSLSDGALKKKSFDPSVLDGKRSKGYDWFLSKSNVTVLETGVTYDGFSIAFFHDLSADAYGYVLPDGNSYYSYLNGIYDTAYQGYLGRLGKGVVDVPTTYHPPYASSGVRVPSVSATSTVHLPYLPSFSGGKVAVPAVPDRVIHEYPNGTADVVFRPVLPAKDGTWVYPDGTVANGRPIGIPVPLDPSIPVDVDLPTYRVPTDSIVSAPDGAISIPDGIAWDTPLADVAVPPLPVDPPADPTDWANKFKTLFTTKFPFSLPWDAYFLLSIVAAEPRAPDISIDEVYRVGNFSLPFKFSYDFSKFDPYISFFRGMILVGFGFALIFATSRFFGGAK